NLAGSRARVLRQRESSSAVGEQASDRPGNGFLTLGDHDGLVLQETVHLVPKVLVGRTDDDGLPEPRGLEHVVPAAARPGPADRDDVGRRIEALEVSDRVDEEDFLSEMALALGACAELAQADDRNGDVPT